MSTSKKWFEISNATEQSADVYIYDSIGAYGVSAAGFIAQMNEINAPRINLHINSGGGSVFDGLAIYNGILSHPAHVCVYIDGIAASMAGVIAMAGDEIVMAQNAFLMIHRVSSYAEGTAETMRAEAALLEKLEEQIVDIYAKRTGKSPGSLFKSMVAETWYNAAECMAEGFCTSVTESKTPENAVSMDRFKSAPAAALATQPRIDAQNTVSTMPTLETAPAVVPVAPAVVIESAPVAVVTAEPVAAITAETLRVALDGARVAHESAINALRAEMGATITSKDGEIAALKTKLASAEQLSAANLGVLPVVHASAPTAPTAGNILAQYSALTGAARTAFFEKNKDAIWKAHDADMQTAR